MKLRNKSIRQTLGIAICLTLVVTNAGAAPEQNNPDSPAIDQKQPAVSHVYFADKDNSYLSAENRVFTRADSPVDAGRQIIEALIKGPQKSLVRTVPSGTSLRAFYLTPNGNAYVDLNEAVTTGHPGGCKTEILTVYSIVNSLILNIPEIESVKILVDGRETRTLAGHVDIRFPFKADMLLIR
jgi:spore germination protein GerM